MISTILYLASGVLFIVFILGLMPVIPVPVSILASFTTLSKYLALADTFIPISSLVSVITIVLGLEALILTIRICSAIYSLIKKT